MHEHGPNCLEGPIRGSQAWWQGLAPKSDAKPGAETPAATPPKKRKDKKIRQDLVDRVRKEIADGTYDTQEKWEAALDRLLDRLHES